MIYFHCPDFYNGFEIYQGINILKHEAVNCFNDDVQIGSIFGTFLYSANKGSRFSGCGTLKWNLYELVELGL